MASCAREKEVLRHYPQLAKKLAQHAETCLVCRKTLHQIDEMAELAGETVALSPVREEKLRGNVLARAEQLVPRARPVMPRVRRVRFVAAAALVALALLSLSYGIVAQIDDEETQQPTQVLSTNAPQVTTEGTPIHEETAVAKTESVVEPIDPPLSARVVSKQGARDAIPYTRGKIEPSSRKPEPVVEPTRVADPTPASATRPAVAPVASGPDPEQLYELAWSALRAESYAQAAKRFLSVTLVATDLGLLEDAQFWRGATQALAGQSRAAAWTLRSFLAQYPSSPRAREAASILGWQLLDLSEIDAAEPVLTFAAQSPNPAVRDKARAGLARVWDHHLSQL